MTTPIKGYVLKDGKLVKKKTNKPVSRKIAERKSKRQKPVSPAKAQLHGHSHPNTRASQAQTRLRGTTKDPE